MTIKIHHLRPAAGSKTAKTRVGRGEGGKGGKTAGRGTKGTKARNTVRVGFEGGQMPLQHAAAQAQGLPQPVQGRVPGGQCRRPGAAVPDGGTVARTSSSPPARCARTNWSRCSETVTWRGRADGERARVLRQCPREDHRRRRHRDPALAFRARPALGRARACRSRLFSRAVPDRAVELL